MIRFFPLFALFVLGCTTPPAATVSADVQLRYYAPDRTFKVSILLTPRDSTLRAQPPTFLGTAVPLRKVAGNWINLAQRPLAYPAELEIGIPLTDGRYHQERFAFPPPVIDNLPDTVRLTSTFAFPSGAPALEADEGLELFFEPHFAGDPRRILVKGPTKTGTITIPAESLQDFAVGTYEVYFIKQGDFTATGEGFTGRFSTEFITGSKEVEVVAP